MSVINKELSSVYDFKIKNQKGVGKYLKEYNNQQLKEINSDTKVVHLFVGKDHNDAFSITNLNRLKFFATKGFGKCKHFRINNKEDFNKCIIALEKTNNLFGIIIHGHGTSKNGISPDILNKENISKLAGKTKSLIFHGCSTGHLEKRNLENNQNDYITSFAKEIANKFPSVVVTGLRRVGFSGEIPEYFIKDGSLRFNLNKNYRLKNNYKLINSGCLSLESGPLSNNEVNKKIESNDLFYKTDIVFSTKKELIENNDLVNTFNKCIYNIKNGVEEKENKKKLKEILNNYFLEINFLKKIYLENISNKNISEIFEEMDGFNILFYEILNTENIEHFIKKLSKNKRNLLTNFINYCVSYNYFYDEIIKKCIFYLDNNEKKEINSFLRNLLYVNSISGYYGYSNIKENIFILKLINDKEFYNYEINEIFKRGFVELLECNDEKRFGVIFNSFKKDAGPMFISKLLYFYEKLESNGELKNINKKNKIKILKSIIYENVLFYETKVLIKFVDKLKNSHLEEDDLEEAYLTIERLSFKQITIFKKYLKFFPEIHNKEETKKILKKIDGEFLNAKLSNDIDIFFEKMRSPKYIQTLKNDFSEIHDLVADFLFKQSVRSYHVEEIISRTQELVPYLRSQGCSKESIRLFRMSFIGINYEMENEDYQKLKGLAYS